MNKLGAKGCTPTERDDKKDEDGGHHSRNESQ